MRYEKLRANFVRVGEFHHGYHYIEMAFHSFGSFYPITLIITFPGQTKFTLNLKNIQYLSYLFGNSFHKMLVRLRMRKEVEKYCANKLTKYDFLNIYKLFTIS
jgi:uncharacterized membrane protein YesL